MLTFCFTIHVLLPQKENKHYCIPWQNAMDWIKWCLSFLKLIPTFPGFSIRYTSLKPDRTSSWKIGLNAPKGKCHLNQPLIFRGELAVSFRYFSGWIEVEFWKTKLALLGPGANPEFCTRIHRGALETIGSGWMVSAMWTNTWKFIVLMIVSFGTFGVLRVSSWWKWSPSTAVFSR